MIVTEKVKLKVNAVSLKHYRDLGYFIPQKNTEIEVNVKDLSVGSHSKVEVKCDVCGKITTMEYRTYLSISRDLSTCNTCKDVKSKNTKKKIYGDSHFNNRNKYKETCMDKFGCDNGFKNKDIKEKIRQTNIERYMVDNPTQNHDILKKSFTTGNKILNFRDTNIYYQGSYELDFLNKFYDEIKIERGFPIKYVMDGVDRVYHPDFYIPDYNMIVEIKSSYWLNKFKNRIECQKQGTILNYNYCIIINKDYSEFKTFLLGKG